MPLTIGFQVGLRRRPLRELWVRTGPPLRLDRTGWLLTAAMLVLPAVRLVQSLAAGQWAGAGWMVACMVGAVAAASALRRFQRADAREWLRWIATAGVTGIALMSISIVPAVIAAGWPADPAAMLVTALEAVLLYIPVQFVLEEVAFRGLLDTHVSERPARRQWPSALVVSVVWALWHLPIAETGGVPMGLVLVQLLLLHCAVGVPLSFGWRRTGNLAVPAIAHALINAVRNALLVGL